MEGEIPWRESLGLERGKESCLLRPPEHVFRLIDPGLPVSCRSISGEEETRKLG